MAPAVIAGATFLGLLSDVVTDELAAKASIKLSTGVVSGAGGGVCETNADKTAKIVELTEVKSDGRGRLFGVVEVEKLPFEDLAEGAAGVGVPGSVAAVAAVALDSES